MMKNLAVLGTNIFCFATILMVVLFAASAKADKTNRQKQTVTPPNSFHVALFEINLFPKPHKQLDVSNLGAAINESESEDEPELVKASGVVKAGATFQILRVQGEWLEIKLSGDKTGWVKSDKIIYDTFKMLAGVKLNLKNKINMYLVPKTASRKKKPLKAGESIAVIAKNETWALVKSSTGRTGWATWKDIGKSQPLSPKIPTPEAKIVEEEIVEEEVVEEEVVEEEVVEEEIIN